MMSRTNQRVAVPAHDCQCARTYFSRRWPGPGAVNTRDMGGLPVRGGHRTRPGVVIRADSGRLSVPTVAVQLAPLYGRVRVLDLRATKEVSADHCPGPQIMIHRFPLRDPMPRPAERGPGYFLEHYLRMLPDAYKAVGQLTRLMEEDTAPVIVTCRIGKDRTGLVMIVLLVMAEVPLRWIVRDFDLTARCYLANLEWVNGYARSRHEEASTVLRRFVLPPSIARVSAEYVIGQLRDRVAWPNLFGVDQLTIDRALNRLICSGSGLD
jgi:protein-tyrosine phosphatase